MGTSHTAADFAHKIHGAGLRLNTDLRGSAHSTASAAHAAMDVAVRSMSGGDKRLSRVGTKGANIGAKTFETHHSGRSVVTVAPVGPVWLVNNFNTAHLIGVGRGTAFGSGRTSIAGLGRSYSSRRLGAAGKPLRMGPGPRDWVTGPVIHPGSPGKHQWEVARDGPTAKAAALITRTRALHGVLAAFT